jgi:myo-inositol-1(or 4)-monophosphatase
MHYFRSDLAVEKKQDESPVTIADRECEKTIVETIKKSFPQHGFLGEEFGKQEVKSDFTWIIDPIDGTRNYARGRPNFGISIGLSKSSKIVVGVMFLPALGEIYTAAAGKGAFLNGKRIAVSKTNSLHDSMIYFDIVKSFIKEKENYLRAYSLLSKAAKVLSDSGLDMLGNVACGRADAYIGPKLSAWDIAAAKLIIEEAGGKLTDFAGNDSIYSENCVASNGLLHKEILQELNK